MKLGDHIEIECADGVFFSGILMEVHPDYVVINGRGFARDMIIAVRQARWPE